MDVRDEQRVRGSNPLCQIESLAAYP
jgi:hypothetical protein